MYYSRKIIFINRLNNGINMRTINKLTTLAATAVVASAMTSPVMAAADQVNVAFFLEWATPNQISKVENPLSIGQFVKLKLIGPKIDVFIIPISAFREQNTILVLDQEDRLTVRKVKSVKRDGLEVWVVGGIQEGERVCITPMDIIAEGMKVKISSSTADQNKTQ